MIYLRELSEEDIEVINKWRQNEELINSLGTPYRYISYEIDYLWYKNYLKNRDSNIRCVICPSESNNIVGMVNLLNLDSISRNAEFSIMIGDKGFHGKGIGLEASKKMLFHAYYNLNLERIYLMVLSENNKAIQLYKKIGFKQEGHLRKAIFKNGEYKDLIIMSQLKEEYLFET